MDKPSFSCQPLLTTAAVAKWLGVSTRAVCLWAECSIIPAIKIGRQWRFRQDDVTEWIQGSHGGGVKNDPNHRASAARV